MVLINRMVILVDRDIFFYRAKLCYLVCVTTVRKSEQSYAAVLLEPTALSIYSCGSNLRVRVYNNLYQ